MMTMVLVRLTVHWPNANRQIICNSSHTSLKFFITNSHHKSVLNHGTAKVISSLIIQAAEIIWDSIHDASNISKEVYTQKYNIKTCTSSRHTISHTHSMSIYVDRTSIQGTCRVPKHLTWYWYIDLPRTEYFLFFSFQLLQLVSDTASYYTSCATVL